MPKEKEYIHIESKGITGQVVTSAPGPVIDGIAYWEVNLRVGHTIEKYIISDEDWIRER